MCRITSALWSCPGTSTSIRQASSPWAGSSPSTTAPPAAWHYAMLRSSRAGIPVRRPLDDLGKYPPHRAIFFSVFQGRVAVFQSLPGLPLRGRIFMPHHFLASCSFFIILYVRLPLDRGKKLPGGIEDDFPAVLVENTLEVNLKRPAPNEVSVL